MVLPHLKRAFRNNKSISGLQHIPFRHPLPGLFPHKPPPRAPQILHSAPQPAKTATPMEAAYTKPSLRLTLLPTEIMTPVEAAYTKPNFASRHHYPTKPSPAEAPSTLPSVHSSKRNGYKQQRKTKTYTQPNIHSAPPQSASSAHGAPHPALPSTSVPKRKHPSKPSFGRPERMSLYK